ncbi:uncharacterized protein LOC115043597 isoform X1 [Echeneis naucrates]|uniref:uncharacterized protein LOC115043597 isoform X1 n=1 Tax=Echeneis naucrates TaxID=173247 RepID=UPI00111376F6|nr:uncharacterized protein LOC115043597 isoform X1 [Echeneis naucrates]
MIQKLIFHQNVCGLNSAAAVLSHKNIKKHEWHVVYILFFILPFVGEKPKLSHEYFSGTLLFTCLLPGSASNETKCNLYFGEHSPAVLSTTIWKKKSLTKPWSCQFSVTLDDFLRQIEFVKQKHASCDFTLGNDLSSLSPRSDRYNLTEWTVYTTHADTAVTPVEATSATDLTVNSSHISTPVTPVKTASDLAVSRPHISTPVTPVAATSVFTSQGLTGRTHSTPGTSIKDNITETGSQKRAPTGVTGDAVHLRNLERGELLPADNDEAYSKITWVTGADCPTASAEPKCQEPGNEDADLNHVYSTISDKPAQSTLKEMVYSTLQPH